MADVGSNNRTTKRLGGVTGKGFKPGQSGNPSGRPAVAREIKELARQYTDVAIEALRTIAEHGKNESARVAAAQALLDRGYGKPTQGLELSGKDGEALQIVINAPKVNEHAPPTA